MNKQTQTSYSKKMSLLFSIICLIGLGNTYGKLEKVLHFTQVHGSHNTVNAYMEGLLDSLGSDMGFTVTHTNNSAPFDSAYFASFDVLIFNNTITPGTGSIATTTALGTAAKRTAFEKYMAGGGKWLALHSTPARAENIWSWFRNDFFRCKYTGHAAKANISVSMHADTESNLELKKMKVLLGIPQSFVINDEPYSFEQCITSGGVSSSLQGQDGYSIIHSAVIGGQTVDYSWTWNYGEGKAIFTALGHHPASYTLENIKMLKGYLNYLTGKYTSQPQDTTSSATVVLNKFDYDVSQVHNTIFVSTDIPHNVEVRNVAGVVVANQNGGLSSQVQVKPGVYMVTVTTEKGQYTKQLFAF